MYFWQYDEKKKDYDIVAAIYPDKDRAKELLGEGFSEESMRDAVEIAVSEVNDIVQTYKHIDHVIIRNEEFPKNSSRKIKRMGITELIMDDYLLSLERK